jgi:hypothetical protein
VSSLLFLTTFLLAFIDFVGDVDFDTKLVTQLVDARTVSANDTTNKFPIDIELGRLRIVYISRCGMNML